MIDSSSWQYPPFPPVRAAKFEKRYRDFEFQWRDQFARRTAEGVIFPAFGEIEYGTVQYALQSMVDLDFDPATLVAEAGNPGGADWLALTPHGGGGVAEGFVESWNDTAPVELTLDDIPRLYSLLRGLWIQWAMFTLRVGEEISNAFHYRLRIGAGNFVTPRAGVKYLRVRD